jgi:hypothetical protein
MSLVRVGGQLLDDERSCVACDTFAVVEEFQTTLPGKADELRRKAAAYERLAQEARAEAEALEAEIETAEPHAFLCGGCRSRLPKQAVGPWSPVGAWYLALPMGGRLSVKPGSQAEAEIVARTLATLEIQHYREPASFGI